MISNILLRSPTQRSASALVLFQAVFSRHGNSFKTSGQCNFLPLFFANLSSDKRLGVKTVSGEEIRMLAFNGCMVSLNVPRKKQY